MAFKHPESWSGLRHPDGRAQLIVWLENLSAPDPRPVWREESQRGFVSGIDEVFHFFFDDNEFDEGDIGYTLFSVGEVAAIAEIRRALDVILADLPNGQDDAFVSHDRWPDVTKAAEVALRVIRGD